MEEQIESEGKVFWQIFVKLLLTPVTLVGILLKKKSFKDLFSPLILLFSFFKQAKVTFLIILALIICYLGQLFLSPVIIDSLALYPTNILSLKIYTLITAGFIHGSVIHLAGNILILFGLGRIVEKEFSSKGFLKIYFSSLILSGLIGSLFSIIVGNLTPGIGASGAIAGVIAAAMLSRPFTFTFIYIIPLPVVVIGLLGLYADVSGLFANDGVGHAVHLGGFFAICLGVYLFKREQKYVRGLIITALLGGMLLVATLLGLI